MLRTPGINKKRVLTVLIGGMLIFSVISIVIVFFQNYLQTSSPLKPNMFRNDTMVYGVISESGTTKYGLIDTEGNVVLEAKYEAAFPIGEKLVGIMQTRNGVKKYGIVNRNGKEITKCSYDAIRFYSGQLIALCENGKWGYADTNGKWVIKPQYDNVRNFSEGVASVSKDGNWFFIDKKGKKLSKDFEDARNLKNGVAGVKQKGKWGFVDMNFNWILKPKYDEVRDLENTLIAFCKDGKWGFLSGDLKEAIAPKYKSVKSFCNGIAVVEDQNGKFGYINTEGEEFIKPQFAGAKDFSSSNRAPVQKEEDGLWGYINSAGEFEIKAQFKDAGVFTDNIAPVSKDGKVYSYINIKGESIIKEDYAYTSEYYQDEYALIQTLDGKWFVIDTSGNKPFGDKKYDILIPGSDGSWFKK